MGVVDEDYLRKANDPDAVVGRKISIIPDEITTAVKIIESLGKRLFEGLLRPVP